MESGKGLAGKIFDTQTIEACERGGAGRFVCEIHGDDNTFRCGG